MTVASIPSEKVGEASSILQAISKTNERIKGLLAEDPRKEYEVMTRANGDSSARFPAGAITAKELLAVERERRIILVEQLREIGIEVGEEKPE